MANIAAIIGPVRCSQLGAHIFKKDGDFVKILHIILFCLLSFSVLGANAQRTLVPIVSFENIPVAIASSVPVSSADIKNAFLAASEEGGWQMMPTGDGAMQGTYVKQNKHTIVVTIRYDAEKYSVLFKSSVNMNQRAGDYLDQYSRPYQNSGASSGNESQAAIAERKQRQLFASRPESPYLKVDSQSMIHPYYEHWVYDLLERVRQKLKRATPGEVQK